MSSAGRRLNSPDRPTYSRSPHGFTVIYRPLSYGRAAAQGWTNPDVGEEKEASTEPIDLLVSLARDRFTRRLSFLGHADGPRRPRSSREDRRCLVPRDLSDWSRRDALTVQQQIGQAMSYAPDSSVRTTGLVNETTNSNVLGPRRGGGGSRAGSGGVKGSGEGERTSRSSPPPALSSGNNTRDEDGGRSWMRRREGDGESGTEGRGGEERD